jgi:hypothetical protein
VCDLETTRIGAPYIYDISNLRVKNLFKLPWKIWSGRAQETSPDIFSQIFATEQIINPLPAKVENMVSSE